MSESVEVPERIGPYRILREVGKGGYARVYLGEEDNGRKLAIKLHFRNRKKALRRFYREFSILSELDHPAIPRAVQFGEHGGAPWMSMRWVEGKTALEDVRMYGRAGSSTRTQRARRVLLGVSEALQFLHSQGILHCDLKPANVIVSEAGQICLVDFGAARWMEDGQGAPIRFVGTRSYAALELLSAQPTDPRTDLFSLGVMAYKLLVGRRPYPRGDAETAIDLLMAARPIPPQDWYPEIPTGLSNLTIELMALHRENRPESAAMVTSRLRPSP